MVKYKLSTNIRLLAILLSVIFITTNKIYAQENDNDSYKNAVTFGLAHSMNFTSITGSFPNRDLNNLKSSISTSNPRFTLGIGMTMDYYFNSKLSLQFDFMFLYNGAHLIEKTTLYNEVGIIENKSYYTYSTRYFKFPLSVNFYPISHFYINGGGYFAPLISSSKYDYWYDSRKPIEDIKPFDYGLVAGFGFNLKYVKLGFQYSYGIGNFIDNSSFNVHHNVFELTARWKFYSDIKNRNK